MDNRKNYTAQIKYNKNNYEHISLHVRQEWGLKKFLQIIAKNNNVSPTKYILNLIYNDFLKNGYKKNLGLENYLKNDK